MRRVPEGINTRDLGARTDRLEQLKVDPGRRTLGELIQERAWAVEEITRLRADVARLASQAPRSWALPSLSETLKTGTDSSIEMDTRRLLRLPEVCKLVGLGKTTIYQLKADSQFPNPVRVGAHAVRWRMAEIVAWQEARTLE
jgi:prophage regulatory protein